MPLKHAVITYTIALALCLGSAGCGAEGTPAPRSEQPAHRCLTIDETTESLRSLAAEGALDSLAEVVDRLIGELNGGRTQQVLELILGVMQALPREESSSFEYQIILDLVDQAKGSMAVMVDFLRSGPDHRRYMFPILTQAVAECPRDSLILTVSDLFESTELMAALGLALDDPTIVNLLENIPNQPEEGRSGFIALIRTMVNAMQSSNFEFSEMRDLLAFLALDEPPMSFLLTELEAYLTGTTFEHLLLTLECLESTAVHGSPGVDVVGGLLYDLMTLDEMDVAGLLSLTAPLLAQLQAADIQIIGQAALDALIEDVELRLKAIDLIIFFLREDNLPPVLEAFSALLETDAIEGLVILMSSITIRCPDEPPSYGVAHDGTDN